MRVCRATRGLLNSDHGGASSATDAGASSGATIEPGERTAGSQQQEQQQPVSRYKKRQNAPAVAHALDTTMQNAIESLTQDDAESALVFALVHDSEFRLATAIASHPTDVDANVVRALLFVFDAYEDQLRKLLGLLMVREMVETLNWNELFRANSTTTAFIREYTCDLGMEFLQHALQDVLLELWDATESYEVNPKLLSSDCDLLANQRRLEALADRVLDRICAAAPLFPYQVAKIYRVLETEMLRLLDRKSNASVSRLSAIGEDPPARASDERKSNTSLPRLSSVGEDFGSSREDPMAATAAAREEFVMHLGGLVFLRFICPAIVLPHKMHLTPDDAAPSKTLQRTLVLVAKLFQSLANNTEYGAREDYMMPFNAFLTRNRSKLLRFYDQICQQAQNDSRRDSLIARSHVTPRISQLWTSMSSTGSKDAIVNLTGAATVKSSDEYLPVLRQWLRRNIAFVTKEVASDRKHRRRSCGVLVAPGAAKTVTTTATAAAKINTKVSKPKRKLKSAPSRTPFPHTGDMNVVKEDDSDDADPSSNNSGSDPLERAASRSRGTSAGVSPEELDAVIGHTSHRDIQLMKLYYAKLSQRGLQRLLEAVDPAGAHAWTAYKCKQHVSVFRKDHSAVPRFVCPSRSFRPRVESKDRFVEMKASIVIRATPRRVFQYLRSLESISEWDEYAARIKKVEPLDESRVIMYRSHPKLSLWPTWLVKPRDSCDLHSFVEKTGRFDTFGVVMESVPRPDVPELKGTVRMSYATGGFLVEPSFSDDTEVSRSADPAQGAFAKLTCVVRADFKGLLPRYLAESICYRQVLSILAIRTKVESVRTTQADSTWI